MGRSCINGKSLKNRTVSRSHRLCRGLDPLRRAAMLVSRFHDAGAVAGKDAGKSFYASKSEFESMRPNRLMSG